MKAIFPVMSVLAAAVAMSGPATAKDNQVPQGTDPAGAVVYSLPVTTLAFEAEAVCENFHAGPYAKYASKYLGIDVRQKSSVTYTLDKISMTTFVEPDLSERHILDLEGGRTNTTFLKLTSAGLVSSAESLSGREQNWKFPVARDGDYSGMSFTPNLSTEATTLYKSVKADSGYDKVAVKQDMLVQKTEEMRAAEIADLIFSLREQRINIITGNTDASYSGEAMGAALKEIDRLEQEYLTLFTGYSEYDRQKKSFEVIPGKDKNVYIAFRISDSVGLLPADNLSGKPVVLEITPLSPAVPQTPDKKVKKTKEPVIVYRIPAVCSVKLSDGVEVLMQSRVPVYQLGKESTLPVKVFIEK